MGRLLHEPHDEVLNHFLDLHEWILGDPLGDHGQQAAVDGLGSDGQERGNPLLQGARLAGAQLRQRPRAALLQHAREVLLRRAGDLFGRQYVDGLLDGLELLAAEFLPGLEVRALDFAHGPHLAEVLLVLSLVGRDLGPLARVLRLVLLGLRPKAGLLRDFVLGVLDVVRQLLVHLLEGVLGIHLLALELVLLGAELVLQLLEHVNDASGLELVAVGLGIALEQVVVGHLLHDGLLQKGGEGLLRLQGHHGQFRDLHQGVLHLQHLRLGTVERLLLQDDDRLAQGVDRLGVVLHSCLEVGGLLLTHVAGRLLVPLPAAHIFRQLVDTAREAADVGFGLLDLCVVHVDALPGGLDLLLLDAVLVAAPLLERGELLGLILLLRKALRMHVCQQLRDLRDRCDRRHRDNQGRGENAAHGGLHCFA
mmetsp:Transcript_127012/g.367668  ORF Transcript_127012/g.367668 Transcript_127012/m.367668 type:complete len:422 (-) Transcript_127012:45-1310(-)